MASEHIPDDVITKLTNTISLGVNMFFNTLHLFDKLYPHLSTAPLSCHGDNRNPIRFFAFQCSQYPGIRSHFFHWFHLQLMGFLIERRQILSWLPEQKISRRRDGTFSP